MTEGACDVHRLLQHHDAEWDPRDPADEANDAEDREDDEHDCGAIVVSDEVIYRCADAQYDLHDACYPDELFRERSCSEEIAPRRGEGNAENEEEEYKGVRVQREGVGVVVDARP